MVPVTLDYSMEMDHDGRTYTVEVKDLPVLRCDQCEAKLLPDASLETMDNELRRMVGLLMPAEITRRRERLHLSQKEFAWLLGIAPATVSRWENGGQIQQRVMNDLMLAFFDLSTLRSYLRHLRAGAAVQGTKSSVAELQPTIEPIILPFERAVSTSVPATPSEGVELKAVAGGSAYHGVMN